MNGEKQKSWVQTFVAGSRTYFVLRKSDGTIRILPVALGGGSAAAVFTWTIINGGL